MGGSAVRILYNPAAGSGRGSRAIAGIRAAFARFGFSDVRATERAGDEARLVTDAIADGIETLVVVGGDGTFSNVAGPVAAAGAPLRLGLIPAGTGNDFVKNLGLAAGAPEQQA
ncbi:MAG: acylglycerol kinase family protein, partial [Gemmatimonadota bacterium]|nr:acylglycerol kinase family protein [Gemmatimonadota bacterium]